MKLFISLCLLVLTHAVYAVQFQVKGIVLDNEGKTVPGAIVSVSTPNLSTLTNVDGFFQLEASLSNKTLLLTVQHIGYLPYKQTIESTNSDTLVIELSSV